MKLTKAQCALIQSADDFLVYPYRGTRPTAASSISRMVRKMKEEGLISNPVFADDGKRMVISYTVTDKAIFLGGTLQQMKERALERLTFCQESGDFESAHADADDVLCVLLRKLGCGEIVDEYSKVRRAFA